MRHIYCANLCGDKASQAASFVLDDFKDAYIAYDGMSASVQDEPSFDFVENAESANVAVIAYELAEDACEYIAKLPAKTKVYGICFGDVMPSQATAGLGTACKRSECIWQGMLLCTKKPVVLLALQGKPRLGWWRRKLSEATDRLIACIRAGVSIKEAADLFGATKKQRAQANLDLILV